MTDHAHIYDNGHCSTCYEREDATVVKLNFLHDQTVKAIDLAHRTIAQLVEVDAYHQRVQQLRAERRAIENDGAA